MSSKPTVTKDPLDLSHAELEQAVRDVFHMFEFFHSHPGYSLADYKKRPEFKFTAIYKLLTR